MFEAYTLLGGLGRAHHARARLGTLVTGATYRHPSLLAKEVTTLDVISRGRALLGIGAAWFELEHKALGFEFPPLRERYELLRDALRITRSMFTRRAIDGTRARTTRCADAYNSPRPVDEGGPPIMIGGAGERVTYRIAAEFADELNILANADEIPRKLAAAMATSTTSAEHATRCARAGSANSSSARQRPTPRPGWSSSSTARGVEDPVAAAGRRRSSGRERSAASCGATPTRSPSESKELLALGPRRRSCSTCCSTATTSISYASPAPP